MALTRRRFLAVGTGTVVSAGVGGAALLRSPSPSPELASVDELSRRLFDALSPEERAEACVPYDHPLRQYHNRGVDTGGAWVLFLGREARQAATDLLYAGLSTAGRERLPQQLIIEWPGVKSMRVLMSGNPHQPPYQIMLSGAHLNLRVGGGASGESIEGAAFGGPQVYGDQRGNAEPGLPGNTYRYQLEAGQALFAGLTAAERKAARQDEAPVQTRLQLQGPTGEFDGIAVGNLAARSRARTKELVDHILGTYDDDSVAYAWQCLEANGGVDALCVADYDIDHQGGRRAGDGPSQIFRLEGPGAILYYRGEPHLHAFVNVTMDPSRPLAAGEVLAEGSAHLDERGVQVLFEKALLAESDADLAYYPLVSVGGQLRAGTIRSGDIYDVESWRDVVTVVEVKGAELAPPQVEALRARGQEPAANRRYRIATTGHAADELADEQLGAVESAERGAMLRDVVIEYVRTNGVG